MIPSIMKTPISLAQRLAGGVLRVGAGGVTAVLRTVLPGGDVTGRARERTEDVRATPAHVVDVTPQPSRVQTPVKKAAAKKATPKKPAATLNEPLAPVDDDPVVYSSGPEA